MGMVTVIILAALAAIVLFFIIVMLVDGNRFVVREYYFCTAHLKKNAKVVLLSDLHNKEYGRNNRALWNAIELAAPDFILVAGDMITSSGRNFAPAITLLTALAGKYPVYYGNGNHEYRLFHFPEHYGGMAAEYEKALSDLPLHRLLNAHTCLPELNLAIYGLDLDRTYYKRVGKNKMTAEYLTEMLGKPDRSRMNLLIAHNPEYFTEYAEWGADLVVSGHVHGGLVRVPFLGGVVSPRLRLFPEYDGGLFTVEKATMVVSRGLGSHTMPIRIFNPGELVVIHLRH